MFYEFNQNNSGGYFNVDKMVCHRIIIESNSYEEAMDKAESIGCYWNGVEKGIDCPCCGDRWYEPDEITENQLSNYFVHVYCSLCDTLGVKAIDEWNEKYGKYNIIINPHEEVIFGKQKCISGVISFKDIEEYAQFMADEYGWTTPDTRIYYSNGDVKEIFSSKNKI